MKIHELLASIKYEEFIGDGNIELKKIVPFDKENASHETLMWVNEKKVSTIGDIMKGTIISPFFNKEQIREGCNYIIVKNPRDTFRFVLQHWFAPKRLEGISTSAIINGNVTIGENVFVGENVVIEQDCSIGRFCTIGHNTVIKANTKIGSNVVIGSNCTIGGVGFGYEKNEAGVYELIPHIGGVNIADNVDIGNNTCIDRGVINDTMIGMGVKIDNLVHIAHGVNIDSDSLIIANSMIAGSVRIAKNVWVAPSASVLNQVSIDDNAVIGMGAVVLKNVAANDIIVGNPGKSIKK